MTPILTGLAVTAAVIAPLAFLAWQFIKAPLAYEDPERGFILGEPDEHADDGNLGI